MIVFLDRFWLPTDWNRTCCGHACRLSDGRRMLSCAFLSNSPVPWEDLCQRGAAEQCHSDNRKEREVRGSHLWAPWFCAVTSQFATRAKNTLLTLRVMLVESSLHFTGRRGNSRLDSSHPAHPKILWALLADSGKLQLLIISVYSLSLALSSLHVPSFVFICFVFFCSYKCKICPFLKADSKLAE